MAGNNILRALLGKNITITATPQDISAAGAMSDNVLGAISFVGRWEEVTGGSTELTSEDATPADCPYDNSVPVGQITRYSITELLTALASNAAAVTGGNRLYKLVQTSTYCKLVLTLLQNGGTNILTETVYVKWTRFDPTFRRGPCRGKLELETIANFDNSGVYQANPATTIT